MLTELHGKAGAVCGPASEGKLRCPLLVRSTSEDVITGHMVQALRTINPRWWLPDLLNEALGTNRFRRQVFRRLRIEPWNNQQKMPSRLLPWKEGSTQVDVSIHWENPPTTIFIEAKYQSDLSMTTSHSDYKSQYPADQLIRNIRVGLHSCGYYRSNQLFNFQPRDFAVILLTPRGKHALVERYRDHDQLLASIPHSDQLNEFPAEPFVGQINYRQIESLLNRQARWFSRPEKVMANTLIEYMQLKKGQMKPRWQPNGTGKASHQ